MKTAIVTGAARGIGKAIAIEFIDRGYFVVLLDNDSETLQSCFEGLEDNSNSLSIVCDVSSLDEVNRSINQVVEKTGRINALVNNAGIASFKPFVETGYNEWREILSVNLDGAFLCSQACVPHMQPGASIVNITSISGLRASTLRTAYGTSKAALAHLTKQMAAELGNSGIRVNAVAPGPVDTAMAVKVHSPEIRADYHDAIPLNRYGSEQEIARVVAFLCSEESSYINGQEIAADGGFESTGIGLSTLRS